MRTLIIGASGFVGAHLIHELTAHGHAVFAASIEQDFRNIEVPAERTLVVDVQNVEQVEQMLRKAEPDWIVNLAAQSSVSRSWVDPIGTARVNILGPLVLFEGIRRSKLKARILSIGSSEEYGEAGSGSPVSEGNALAPNNPYGVSKYAQELYCSTYFQAYGTDMILVRAFPHTGPGQRRGFVVPDFCAQIAEAEREGAEPLIKVGNLVSRRDLTDVRDIVRGYHMLLESGKSGQVYNIGSGRAVRIGDILDILVAKASRHVRVEVASEKLRPIEVFTVVADTSRIKAAIGWEPEIPLEMTLADTLDYWRQKISEK